MGLVYYKRYRMEADLRSFSRLADKTPGWSQLPPDYRLLAWTPQRLEAHAETKYHSFRQEIDAVLFDCLATPTGCQQLMEEISLKPGFSPEATWLVEYSGVSHKPEVCGAIQGVRATPRYGAIQNVGVTAQHRGRGLGRVLVTAALQGFLQCGLRRAYLEVTAENVPAVELYKRMGFRRVKTLYKAVKVAYAAPAR